MHEVQISGRELQVFATLWSTNRQNDFLSGRRVAKGAISLRRLGEPAIGVAARGFAEEGHLECGPSAQGCEGRTWLCETLPLDAFKLHTGFADI